MRELSLIYANVQSGLEAGRRLDLLDEILRPIETDDPPALVMFCEGRWWDRGGQARFEVARILRRIYGVHYQVEVGGIARSDDPPVLAVRSDLFAWHRWNTPHNDHHRYSHNSALLAWAHEPERVALRVQIAHLDYASGEQRLIEAQALASQFDPNLVNILAGDFNSAPSGGHCGRRDFLSVPTHKRNQKGRLVQIGDEVVWTEDTRALDCLVGTWSHRHRQRFNGAGYMMLAEADWLQNGRPDEGLAPTTTTKQSLPIDHILTDWTVELVPGSYQVRLHKHSDHAVISATIRIPF